MFKVKLSNFLSSNKKFIIIVALSLCVLALSSALIFVYYTTSSGNFNNLFDVHYIAPDDIHKDADIILSSI